MSDASKEVVFTWKIANFSYGMQEEDQLESPKFQLCNKSIWSLSLDRGDYGGESKKYIGGYLNRKGKPAKEISLKFTLELLNAEGLVLKSITVERYSFAKVEGFGTPYLERLENIYELRRNEFLPMDTLSLRCRIQKADGSFLENAQFLATTHIKIEKLEFLWCIKDFSASSSQGAVVVKTACNPKRQFTFNLFKKDLIKDLICIQMAADYGEYAHMLLFCEYHFLDRCKKKIVSIKKELWFETEWEEDKWKFAVEAEIVLQDRAVILSQNDGLYIQCQVVFSNYDYVEFVYKFEMQDQENMVNTAGFIKREIETSVSNHLNQEWLRMYQEGTFSDVTLQTETGNYRAHKSLLCARSPVFHKMFTVDMKEKTTNNVQIDDLDACTVHLFLLYIYNDSLENLDLDSAQKLYFAADKYEVSSLRDKCVEFILTELTEKNVCDILILADHHQDKTFKDSVIVFILNHFQEIFREKEWESLMKNNSHLAAEVMYKKLSDFCCSSPLF